MAIIFQVRVASSNPKQNPEGYLVTKYTSGWDCECQGFGYRHECRHQSNVEGNYRRLRLHRSQELIEYQHSKGWITEEEYEATLPGDTNLTQELPDDLQLPGNVEAWRRQL